MGVSIPYRTTLTLSTFPVNKQRPAGRKSLTRKDMNSSIANLSFTFVNYFCWRLRVPTRHMEMVVPAAWSGGVLTRMLMSMSCQLTRRRKRWIRPAFYKKAPFSEKHGHGFSWSNCLSFYLPKLGLCARPALLEQQQAHLSWHLSALVIWLILFSNFQTAEMSLLLYDLGHGFIKCGTLFYLACPIFYF